MIDFELPKELIAQEPARPRDHARLLVYNRTERTMRDDYFYNLLDYLPKQTTVVVNNSKVDNCRYLFHEGKREIFALESVNNKTVRALVRPGKVFKLGKTVQLTEAISAEVVALDEDGIRTIIFSESLDHSDLIAAQHIPLPPYIAQNDTLAAEYQTIYAKTNGSKAAPTAGLHFTDELKKNVQAERDWAEVTLHVGLGTFAPLSDEQIQAGRLHEERYKVAVQTAQQIAKAEHVTAVGTTSVRTLESVFAQERVISSLSRNMVGSFESAQDDVTGSTDILIQPGYQFQRVNSLITNFHLPGTSLLLLVEAFVGDESEMQRIYDHAIKEQYRFYSFGDCMLVL